MGVPPPPRKNNPKKTDFVLFVPNFTPKALETQFPVYCHPPAIGFFPLNSKLKILKNSLFMIYLFRSLFHAILIDLLKF